MANRLTDSQTAATRFTHAVVYACDEQVYAAVSLNNLVGNGDLIKANPLKKYKAGFGQGPKRLEMTVQLVTVCLNKKVSEKLANLCVEVTTMKNVADDYFVANAILPRSCDIRTVDAVPEWFGAKVETAIANFVRGGGQRRSTRTSAGSLPKATLEKETADETSDDTECSADGDDSVVVELDKCTVPKPCGKSKSTVHDIDADCTDSSDEGRARTTTRKQSGKVNARCLAKSPDDHGFDSAEDLPCTSTQIRNRPHQFARGRSTSSGSECSKRGKSNASVNVTPKKRVDCRQTRKLLLDDSPHTPEPELQSPTFPSMDKASSPNFSLSSAMIEQTTTMMQVMLENSRQLRKDYDELKKVQRSQAKEIIVMKVALGRITSDKRVASDSLSITGKTSSASAKGGESIAEDQELNDEQSADGLRQSTLDKHQTSSSNSVGSIRWIRSTYGIDKAREIVSGLRKLNVPITKWPSIFEGRFAADKLMATRLLKARFTEEELANFCMSRPSQSKALDSSKTQGTSKDAKKMLLPDKDFMIDLLAIMAMDGYTPQNAHIRFQSALTVANRNQRSKTADKHADSDSSLTEVRGDRTNNPVGDVVVEDINKEPDVPQETQVQEELSSSQLPLACSTQVTNSDPNKTTLVQEARPPSPIEEEEEEEQDVYVSEEETQFVME